ncbi:MAG: hypothetical protein F6K17_09085, partial [Okeania sp. SIO3C4]|nr:hypothetical protein [Okeania sp. SIO3C4]
MTQQFQELNEQRLLSHGNQNETIEQTIERIKQRIIQTGDKPHVTVARQLELLNELAGFPLGQFFLQNPGLNGYWIVDFTDIQQLIKSTVKFNQNKRMTKQSQEFNEQPILSHGNQN